MVNVYHELQHPVAYLMGLSKAIKPNGQLLLIKYKEEDPTITIKTEQKMSVRQAKKELTANGFRLVKTAHFYRRNIFYFFRKQVVESSRL